MRLEIEGKRLMLDLSLDTSGEAAGKDVILLQDLEYALR
jgi:hypothetical protein